MRADAPILSDAMPGFGAPTSQGESQEGQMASVSVERRRKTTPARRSLSGLERYALARALRTRLETLEKRWVAFLRDGKVLVATQVLEELEALEAVSRRVGYVARKAPADG